MGPWAWAWLARSLIHPWLSPCVKYTELNVMFNMQYSQCSLLISTQHRVQLRQRGMSFVLKYLVINQSVGQS